MAVRHACWLIIRYVRHLALSPTVEGVSGRYFDFDCKEHGTVSPPRVCSHCPHLLMAPVVMMWHTLTPALTACSHRGIARSAGPRARWGAVASQCGVVWTHTGGASSSGVD